jgi:hypothetical protein
METYQSLKQSRENLKIRLALQLLKVLSWYPFLLTIGILMIGTFQKYYIIKNFMLLAIASTFVIYFYIGVITWSFLIIYLPLKKKITLKQTLIYFLIVAIGYYAVYYVVSYDILNSGVKYMD